MTRHRGIRFALVAVIVLVIGIVTAVFLGYRRSPQDLVETVLSDAELTIRHLEHTATREGFTEWHLEADEARYRQGEETAELIRLAVVFFLEDGRNVRLTADHGELDTATNDMDLRGNVRIVQDRMELATDRLRYGHGERRIHSEAPVTLTGTHFTLTADRMIYDLADRRIRFEGQVDGSLTEQLAM